MADIESLKERAAKARAGKAEALKARRGNPVAPEGAAEMSMRDAAQVSIDQAQGFDDAVFGNLMSGFGFNYDDEIGAATASPIVSLMSQFGEEPRGIKETYRDLQQQYDGEKQRLREAQPVASLVGQLPGLLATGGGLAKGATKVYEMGKTGVNAINMALRPAAQGVAGAGAGALDAAGDDDSVGFGAIVGGLLGAGSQALTEGYSAIKGLADPEVIKTKLAQRVFGDLNNLSTEGVTPQGLIARRQELGPDALVADTSDSVRNAVSGVGTAGASRESIGDLARAAASRDVPEIAENAFMTAFGGPRTQAAEALDRSSARAALGTQFKQTLVDMDASGTTVNPNRVAKMIDDTFGPRPQPTLRAAKDQADEMIRTAGGFDPETGKFTRNVTPSELVEIKQEIDRSITRRENGVTTMDRDARNKLIDVKNNVNGWLKEQFPEYADVTSKYGGEFELQGAWQEGMEALRSDAKTAVPDAMGYYRTLSTEGQQSFKDGLVYSIFAKGDAEGATALLLKQAGPKAKSDILMRKVDEMFGPQISEQLYAQADTLLQFTKTNNMTEQMRAAAEKATAGDPASRSMLRSVIDYATLASMGAQGMLRSGAAYGAAGRRGAAATSSTEGLVSTEFANFAANKGDDADKAIQELYGYFTKPHQPPMLPINMGVFANQ